MKRFRSAVLVLAIAFSLGLHSLLFFRFFLIETDTVSSKPSMYQVTLKYFSAPAEVRKEQPKKRLKREKKKQEPEKEPVEKEEEPEIQEEPVVQDEPDVQIENSVKDESEMPREGEKEGIAETEESELFDDRNGVQVIEEEDIRYNEAIAGLRNNIMKNKIYPQVARKRNIEGVVQVLLKLDEHGQLVELQILESSGSKILDKAAISLIRKVLPFDHGLGRGFSVKIPIRYDLS